MTSHQRGYDIISASSAHWEVDELKAQLLVSHFNIPQSQGCKVINMTEFLGVLMLCNNVFLILKPVISLW